MIPIKQATYNAPPRERLCMYVGIWICISIYEYVYVYLCMIIMYGEREISRCLFLELLYLLFMCVCMQGKVMCIYYHTERIKTPYSFSIYLHIYIYIGIHPSHFYGVEQSSVWRQESFFFFFFLFFCISFTSE